MTLSKATSNILINVVYTDRGVFDIVMLSAIMLRVIMLDVVAPPTQPYSKQSRWVGNATITAPKYCQNCELAREFAAFFSCVSMVL